MRPFVARLLDPAAILFALLPFQWISLGSVAGFNVKLPYVAVPILLLAMVFNPRSIAAAAVFLQRMAVWLLPYLAYLLILFLVLYGSKAQGTPVRQVFYLAGVVGLGAWLAAAQDVRRAARWAGAASIVTFLLATEIMARGIGLSWGTAVGRFVTSGDLNFVVYSFFRAVFNSLNTDGDALIGASQKNALAVALLAALQLYRAGCRPERPDRLGMVVTVLVFFVLLMLNTRSVLLVGLLSLPLLVGLGSLRARHHNVTAAILKTSATLLTMAAIVVVLTSDSSLVQSMADRFSFEDSSTGARVEQYAWALQRIEGAMLTGSGYAEIHGQPVHNLFLSAFMHAGLAAFLLIVVFYLGILFAWLRFLAQIVLAPRSWVLPMRAEWVAVLPMVPLSRVWLAGDAGHPAMAEWVALACFFGLVLANRQQAAQAA